MKVVAKAISLHQPWASLVMLGVKRVETRSWKPPASVIGSRVMIHAAKRIHACVLDEPFSTYIADPVRDAPMGVLLGSVLIEGAWVIDHAADAVLAAHEYHRKEDRDGKPFYDKQASEHELAFGDFTVGRWMWGLAESRRLNVPIPYDGAQRFFNVERMLGELLSGEHG